MIERIDTRKLRRQRNKDDQVDDVKASSEKFKFRNNCRDEVSVLFEVFGIKEKPRKQD